MEQFKLSIDLPEEVLAKIESVISRTIEKTLSDHVRAIQAQPKKLSRREAAALLKISLPTLRERERDGSLIPQRAGRRLLYDQRTIDTFLDSSSRG